jgi:hypothetical protein
MTVRCTEAATMWKKCTEASTKGLNLSKPEPDHSSLVGIYVKNLRIFTFFVLIGLHGIVHKHGQF